jgi:hypothetical protein
MSHSGLTTERCGTALVCPNHWDQTAKGVPPYPSFPLPAPTVPALFMGRLSPGRRPGFTIAALSGLRAHALDRPQVFHPSGAALHQRGAAPRGCSHSHRAKGLVRNEFEILRPDARFETAPGKTGPPQRERFALHLQYFLPLALRSRPPLAASRRAVSHAQRTIYSLASPKYSWT